MKDLPEFKRLNRDFVTSLAAQLLTRPEQPEQTYLRRLAEYDDGHYGAVFSLAYFVGTDEPTKSQWSSLKKRLKRHDRRVFVFKEHSLVPCETAGDGERCGCLEFGFFAHETRPGAE